MVTAACIAVDAAITTAGLAGAVIITVGAAAAAIATIGNKLGGRDKRPPSPLYGVAALRQSPHCHSALPQSITRGADRKPPRVA